LPALVGLGGQLGQALVLGGELLIAGQDKALAVGA
jgi:hypothetical protein